SGETLGSVERFDLKTNRWSDVGSLRIPRSRLSLVALNGKLYAVSGMKAEGHGHEALNTPSIEEYDPAKNAWRIAGSLNHARHGFGVSVWHRCIYVFGGNDGESERSGEVWDPMTGKSVDLPNMPSKRGFPGVVQVDGRLVCFGGRSVSAHPSALDPDTLRWSDVPVPDIDLNRTVSTLIGGKLWTIGGESRSRSPIIQSFDLTAWHTKPLVAISARFPLPDIKETPNSAIRNPKSEIRNSLYPHGV
ncbi:MAG: Kelch repeat-containing protein, partial [Fimbriimonadales bacterium]